MCERGLRWALELREFHHLRCRGGVACSRAKVSLTTILNVDIPTNNRPATNGLAFPFARMITEKEGQHCEEGDHDACDGR